MNDAPAATLLDQAVLVERMLDTLPEDPQNALDGRTRAALAGWVRGVRDATRALGNE